MSLFSTTDDDILTAACAAVCGESLHSRPFIPKLRIESLPAA